MGLEPRRRFWVVWLGFLLACRGGPSEASPSGGPGAANGTTSGVSSVTGSKLARVQFPDGRSFLAEVADTPGARARGLMFRDRLGKREGMVFLFQESGFHSFWMKNCLISLDILWLDAAGRVVHMEKSVPPCKTDPCPAFAPLRASSWALEVGSGETNGVRLGDQLLVGPEHTESSSAPPHRE